MSKQLVVNDFARLPELLARAGMVELLPAPPTGSDQDQSQQPSTDLQEPHTAADTAGDTAASADEVREVASTSARWNALERPDLSRLQAELAAAGAALAELVRRDQRDRAAVLQEVERYDSAVAALADAGQVRDRAKAVQEEARRLAEIAISAAVRQAAEGIATTAANAETAAAHRVEEQRQVVQSLATRPTIQRALAERRRRLETEPAQATAAARAERRDEAVCTARVAMESGWLDEARSVLQAALDEHAGDAEVAALLEEVARHETAARESATVRAVRAARRAFRHRPAEAIGLLVTLDLRGVAPALRSQVFGAWTRACARLCRQNGGADPLLYAPALARGAVLTPGGADGRYAVVSALDMGPQWVVGRLVDARVVQLARPLRR